MANTKRDKGLLYMGKFKGFSQRTFQAVDQTPFLPSFPETGLWRSPVNQQLTKADLEEFVLRSHSRPDDQLLTLAVQRTMERFKLPQKVKMIHLNDVFQQDLDIWTKSPGLPWRDLGYKTKGDIRKDPEAIRRVRKFAHFVKNGYNMKFPDCLAYVRSHTCEVGEYKLRAVWGYPATITFMEAMFAVPLIKGYQSMIDESRPIAYGFETAIGGMKKLSKRFRRNDLHYTRIEFSKFDKTVPPWLIDIAFDIMLYNIDLLHYEDRGVADVRKMALLFYSLKWYFIKTTIRLTDGCRYKKFSGIASGSYFTHLVGSIVNSILINWLSLKQFSAFPEDCIFLGDDSFISSTREWNLEYCNKLVNEFEMTINVSESNQSTNMKHINFLGYVIGDDQPMKSHSEWMIALLLPERPDKEFSDIQSRALGLYYTNMCIDEEFARICKTIVTLKHFDLAFTSNFERMLKHIGICLSSIDPYNFPSSLDK